MNKYLIVYDDVCPMCAAYTASFHKLGWTDRTGFAQTASHELPEFDIERARHEIPLLDRETGKVRYGLKALFHLIGEHVPLLRPVLDSKLTYYALWPLYRLITFNRRIIAGTSAPEKGFDCAPDFHRGWRLTYCVLALLGIVLLTASKIGVLAYALVMLAWLLLGLVLLGQRGENPSLNDKLQFAGHYLTIGLMMAMLIAILPNLWLSPLLAGTLGASEMMRRQLY